jgi:hypothetical protein
MTDGADTPGDHEYADADGAHLVKLPDSNDKRQTDQPTRSNSHREPLASTRPPSLLLRLPLTCQQDAPAGMGCGVQPWMLNGTSQR